MKKIPLILTVTLAALLLFTACSEKEVSLLDFHNETLLNMPLYFPKPEEPDFLYTIDRGPLVNYEKIMLASMQGVTAKDKPIIFILENESLSAVT